MAEKFAFQNPFTGMNNNPINIIDPTGMYGESANSHSFETRYYVDGKLVYDDEIDNGIDVHTTQEEIDKHTTTDAKGHSTTDWDGVRNSENSAVEINQEQFRKYLSQLSLANGNQAYSFDGRGNITPVSSPLEYLELLFSSALEEVGVDPKVVAAANIVWAFRKGDFKKISDSFLKKKKIDAHALKKEYLGKKAKIAQYDLYKDNKTGQVLIFKKGGKGEGIPTHEFLD